MASSTTCQVAAAASERGDSTTRWTYVLLLALLCVICGIRWHRLGVPLERDEGEYAYAAQLLLDGVQPFQGTYNMKLPGIYAAYALVLGVFGESTRGIHAGLLVVNLLTTLIVFLLGRRIAGPWSGLGAAAAFGVAALDPTVTGLFANSEHFVMFPVVLGLLVLWIARENSSLAWSMAGGLLFGVGFVIKQHAAAFVIFGAIATLVGARFETRLTWWASARRCAAYAVGAMLPFGVVCAWMSAAGVFERFWFWTFTYASTYVGQVSLAEGWSYLTTQLARMAGPLIGIWCLAAFGLSALIWDKSSRRFAIWLTGLGLFSFAATCPGLMFREHYFVLALPAAGIFAGVGLAAARRVMSRLSAGPTANVVAAACLAGAVVAPIVLQRHYYLNMSDNAVSRSTYGPNPFPEAVIVADYIRTHTQPGERIAVIGSEPQIYFHANRRAATGHIYTYALMEEHPFALEMQKEMMTQIETSQPSYIVYVHVQTSWLVRTRSNQTILEWVPGFLHRSYTQVGLLDIVGFDRTDQYWDAAVKGKKPGSEYWLGVYRRS